MNEALISQLKSEVENRYGLLCQRAPQEREDIPCVFDLLDNEIKMAFQNRAEAGKALYYNANNAKEKCIYKSNDTIHKQLTHFKELIEGRVAEYKADYFIVTNYDSAIEDEVFIPNIIPVTILSVPLFSAKLDDSGSVIWAETGDTRDMATFMGWIAGEDHKSIRVLCKEDGVLFDSYFKGAQYRYIAPRRVRDATYRLCKDCGEFFVMYDSEVAYYKNQGLCVPKRCYSCREKRSANKEV